MITFLRSPLGRYLCLALAAVAIIGLIHHHGYAAGVKHERALADKQLAAAARDLGTCRANGSALESEIAHQNAQVAELKAERDRKTQAAAEAVSVALRGRSAAEKAAADLLARPPAGIDECARAESAFRNVKDALR